MKGNPRAIAVSARTNLVALSMRDQIRAHRYRSNPNGRWAGIIDCVDD
jgi:hypothetical protein